MAVLLGVHAIAVPVHAELFFQLDAGNAELSDSRFDGAAATRVAGGYRFGSFSVMASAYGFNEFVLNSNPNAKFELDGDSVAALWTMAAGPIKLDLGGGLFDWKSKTTLYGYMLGQESGTSRMLEASARTSLGSLGVYLNARLVEDVSDEDLTLLSAGIQLSF